MKVSKTSATVIVIFACIGVVFLGRLFFFSKPSDSQVTAARAKGNPKAKIQIIEYLDYQCPACARGAMTLKEYLKKFPDDIYLQVRYYPITQIHPFAIKSAMFAECAARQDKFWPFQDLLVSQQEYWSKRMNVDGLFRQMAAQSSVDLKKLDTCLADESVTKTILAEKSRGKSAGVNSTPTYFINGKVFVGPKPLMEELEKLLGAKDIQ